MVRYDLQHNTMDRSRAVSSMTYTATESQMLRVQCLIMSHFRRSFRDLGWIVDQSEACIVTACIMMYMQRSIVGTGLGIACFTVEKKLGLIAVAEKVRNAPWVLV